MQTVVTFRFKDSGEIDRAINNCLRKNPDSEIVCITCNNLIDELTGEKNMYYTVVFKYSGEFHYKRFRKLIIPDD